MNPDRIPVASAADLAMLDERDVISGYWAGFHGDGQEPGIEFNRDYWHGWRNGMVDSGRMKPDAAQAQLAREVVASGALAAA